MQIKQTLNGKWMTQNYFYIVHIQGSTNTYISLEAVSKHFDIIRRKIFVSNLLKLHFASLTDKWFCFASCISFSTSAIFVKACYCSIVYSWKTGNIKTSLKNNWALSPSLSKIDIFLSLSVFSLFQFLFPLPIPLSFFSFSLSLSIYQL